MRNEINLSLGRKKESPFQKRLLIGTSILFIFVFIVSLGILSYRLYLGIGLSKLSDKEESFAAQISAVKESRDKLAIVKERLGGAQKILSKRQNITNKFDEAQVLIPSGATLETFTGEKNEVEISVESASLDKLTQLINEKISTLATDKKNGVKKIEMKSFTLNPNSKIYSVVFNVVYK